MVEDFNRSQADHSWRYDKDMAMIVIRGVPHTYELTAATVSGQVLVFIHGWLLSSRYWQPLLERLAPDYRCLVYDLRGFGNSQPDQKLAFSPTCTWSNLSSDPMELVDSDQPTPRYTPSAYAQDLAILLEALQISSAWLIGHSLGGSIALWGASKLPQVVKGAVCVNSGGGIYLKEEFERFRTMGQKLLKLRPRWLSQMPFLNLLFTRDSVAHPIARHWGRQRVIDLVMAHPEAALGTLLDSTTETEVHLLPQLVAKLQQPVYFIAGANDSVMEPKYVRHLASFHPMFQSIGENVIEIPNCGHMSMVEQPDAVAQEIRQILAQYD